MEHFPPRRTGGSGWGHRDLRSHRAFARAVRRRVIAQYGQAICERCGSALELDVHHTQPGNDDPDTGRLLCNRCHCIVDPHARRRASR